MGIIHFKLCDAMIHCDGGDGELLRDQEEGLESRRDKNSKDRLPPITRNIALLYSGHQKSIANRHLSGRHRWIDYSQDDFNASQVPPEWHSWIHHIRKDAPTDDVIMKQLSPPWKAPFVENMTGTRGHFKTYSTTAPKIQAWDPVVKPRGGAETQA